MSHNLKEPTQLDLFQNQLSKDFENYLRKSIEDNVLKQLKPTAHYQQAVVLGQQNLSGSDLRGLAKRYSTSYYFSRRKVADLWVQEGGHIRQNKWTGELTLEVGDIPENSKYVVGGCACHHDDVWRY